MKYSKLFGKTVRQAPADAVTVSHQLLYKAGFIRESTAGRYFSLPLANRVERKIMKIIKEEMDKTGAQEMLSPVLHPLCLWQETNRTKTTSFELMTVKDRRDFEFALGGTAEEMMVDVVRKFNISYRDLPFNIYQFSTKFRDELRARGGLLRVREFIMKDAYSFDRDETEFKKTYRLMAETYNRIFERLALKTVMIEADNGYIGGQYCHEFVVESEIGESRYLVSEDGRYAAHEDVAGFKREMMTSGEAERPFQTVNQPEWVKTMEDNVKHYGQPKWRFLKNVVYKNITTEELIIAVIRGDLAVNKTKLEHVVDAVGQLKEAGESDLGKIGTKSGFVHSWGYRGVRHIGDLSLTSVRNFIGGQKETGTDSINVNYGRDFTCEKLVDIATAQEGYLTEDGSQKLLAKKGIEVGNIFQLGYHYTHLMKDANFVDSDGKPKPYYMGCYGIGIGRTLATLVEIHHDAKGIKWPAAVAPFNAHLIGLDLHDKAVWESARQVYKNLSEGRIETLFDDRLEVTAGEKFADVDLIGIPCRLVVSQKSLSQGGVEVKKRSSSETKIIPADKIVETLSVYSGLFN